MANEPQRIPDDELRALITEPHLDLLPKEALIGSIRYLAEHLLAWQAMTPEGGTPPDVH